MDETPTSEYSLYSFARSSVWAKTDAEGLTFLRVFYPDHPDLTDDAVETGKVKKRAPKWRDWPPDRTAEWADRE